MSGTLKRPAVLIVEDDPMLLMLTTDMVTILGYDAIQVPSADLAIKILEHGEQVCAIFTDVMMPGEVNGLALAHVISNRWPRIGIVIASGRHPEECEKRPAHSRFLRKPYDLRMVEGALHQVITETSVS
jgi:CheY-like chemotaxis protein